MPIRSIFSVLLIFFLPSITFADSQVLPTVAASDIAASDSMVKTKAVFISSVDESEEFEIQTDTKKHSRTIGEPLRLGIKDFIALVKEKNERIISQQLEWSIREDAVTGERSIFEPDLVSSYVHQKSLTRSTAEEFISRSSTLSKGGDPSLYNARNNYYKAAVEKLLQPGTRVRLEYNLDDLSNSQSDLIELGLSQYRTFVGINLEQPLLKNGGIKTVMAGIHIAEAEADIAFQTYRQKMIEEIFEAASSYWDLYLAQEKHKARQDSVRIAEELLKHNQEWVDAGKMAENEILEAEAGLALRRSMEKAAEQDVVSATNRVRTFFSSSVAETEHQVLATDRPQFQKIDATFGRSIEKAFNLRPDYISGLKKVEREGVRIAFANNQRWPQVDIKASYGLNGLDTSPRSSYKDARSCDFETWHVGLELRIPLGGDQKSKSGLEAAKKRKKQALLEIKGVEVVMANETDTAVRNLHNSYKQVLHFADAVRLREHLLKVEVERFKGGKSDSRLLLEREEDLLKAKEAELESLMNYTKACLGLEKVEGSLLLSHGIEVMEVEK